MLSSRQNNKKLLFQFFYIDREEILLEMCNLNQSKASQDTDMPPKIFRNNADILNDFIHSSSNNTITNSLDSIFLKTRKCSSYI